jgi:hypothetical protein
METRVAAMLSRPAVLLAKEPWRLVLEAPAAAIYGTRLEQRTGLPHRRCQRLSGLGILPLNDGDGVIRG